MKPLHCKQWSSKEDQTLRDYIEKHGPRKWDHVGIDSGLNRTGKSCRLRWLNHLKPGVKKGSFSDEEREKVLRLHSEMGKQWSKMAKQMPGRSDNDIKNFWHTQGKRSSRKESVQSDGCLSSLSFDIIYEPMLWNAVEAGSLEFALQYDEPVSLGGAPWNLQ